MIRENLESVTRRISRCCKRIGRPSDSVRLVCVTKEASVDQAEELLGLGIRDLGENRVQELVAKHKIIANRADWHLIGHLQTNKVRDAVRIAQLIHSVDSARLAKEIDREAGKIGKIQDILIEINTSGEATKFGIKPSGTVEFLKELTIYPNISIKGLMTIAPEADDPEKVRPYFRALRELRNRINNSQLLTPNSQLLSMGMSNDFEVAIEEGSNMVRIGRAIFSV